MNSDFRLEKVKHTEEDVTKGRVDHLIEHRIPWIVIGLLGGLVATVIVSKFEAILSADVRLAFFIPIIVYLSDAVGTQTETIYIRELSEKKINFWRYIFKESIIGLSLGVISGVILGIFATFWLSSFLIGLTIGLTMLINLTLAPILAVSIPSILYRRRSDPALGAGPVATIIQDLISLLVYFLIASAIIFN
ncbi:MAG: magnesium transporter [Candidatus Paceibacterota bacterium]|jgi:magnesium transporter